MLREIGMKKKPKIKRIKRYLGRNLRDEIILVGLHVGSEPGRRPVLTIHTKYIYKSKARTHCWGEWRGRYKVSSSVGVRIRMFLGLPDPHPAPDPSIIKQK